MMPCGRRRAFYCRRIGVLYGIITARIRIKLGHLVTEPGLPVSTGSVRHRSMSRAWSTDGIAPDSVTGDDHC